MSFNIFNLRIIENYLFNQCFSLEIFFIFIYFNLLISFEIKL